MLELNSSNNNILCLISIKKKNIKKLMSVNAQFYLYISHLHADLA